MKAITISVAIVMLSLFTLMTASAQNEKEFTGALLWKISGNGLDKPSYILGTHHLIHVNFVDSIPGLRTAIDEAEQTVGELLMDDMAGMQAKMQQAAMMPAGYSYKDMLSPEDYVALDNGLKEVVGAGLDNFGMLKPGMISMVYTITTYTKLYPEYNPMGHEGIDAYVQRIAKENGKLVLGLETIDDQIYAIFDSAPLKEQAEGLACAVKNSNTIKDQLDKLNFYYKTRNLLGMYNLAFNNPDDVCKSSKEQENAVNKDRNDKWVKKLPQIMKDKSSLVAVGALHLAEQEGILYQLSQLGYKIEPVK